VAVDLRRRAWAEVREGLELIAAKAERLGMAAYLVGGPVRDALTGHRVADIDVAVEGRAARLAQALAAETGGVAVVHRRFLTAEVRLPDGRHWDITTARAERYPRPGALPVVKRATMGEDVWRRDFTVNAMALRLGPAGPLELLDPTGGRADLAAGILRALHERSFVDDPTRIVRAAVYAERLRLRPEPKTERWLREAVADGALATVSGPRLGEQLRRGLETPAGGRILRRLAEWGALSGLRLPVELAYRRAMLAAERGRRRLGLDASTAAAAMLALTAGAAGAKAATFLALPASYGHACAQFERATEHEVAQRLGRGDAGISAVDALLGDLAPATVLAIWAVASPAARPGIEAWWQAATALSLAITGDDLTAAGVPQGPAIGVGLRAARLAALDGKARGRKTQLRVALAAAQHFVRRP
jgi:tRNA nucleotidyltransferase (CCA-adding enzyme)